jgi:hypothetical protein
MRCRVVSSRNRVDQSLNRFVFVKTGLDWKNKKHGIIKTREDVGGKMMDTVVGGLLISITEGRGVSYFYHLELTRVSGVRGGGLLESFLLNKIIMHLE